MKYELPDKPRAVIRCSPMDGRYYVCHAYSYQNALRSSASTREQAVALAERYGFLVIVPPRDQHSEAAP